MLTHINAPAMTWWIAGTWTAYISSLQTWYNLLNLTSIKCTSYGDLLTETWSSNYYVLYFSNPSNPKYTIPRTYIYWRYGDEIDFNNINTPIILSWSTILTNYTNNDVKCILNIDMPKEYVSFLNYWNIFTILFILFVPLLMAISTTRKIKNKNLDLTKIKNLFSNIKKNEK